MKKNINIRQCCSCKKKYSKFTLIKLVKLKENPIYYIDYNYKINGRGIYICKNKKCILKSQKNKKINKIFSKTNVELIEKNFILL